MNILTTRRKNGRWSCLWERNRNIQWRWIKIRSPWILVMIICKFIGMNNKNDQIEKTIQSIFFSRTKPNGFSILDFRSQLESLYQIKAKIKDRIRISQYKNPLEKTNLAFWTRKLSWWESRRGTRLHRAAIRLGWVKD